MFIIISPAKKLLTPTKPYSGKTTEPLFADKTSQLAKEMKGKTTAQIAELMALSKNLAQLNHERYQQFKLQNCPPDQSYPAVLFFQGDVYQGLAANRWSAEDLNFAQTHLGILSGLYGLLRPLDRIQPYRLEMGVRLANPLGDNLYTFWQETLIEQLNQRLASEAKPLLINLASIEYFKAIDVAKLQFPLVTINFYEQKNNEIKMIGIYSKKARGLMTNYLIKNRVNSLEKIKEFSESGYQFDSKTSSENELNFLRIH